MTYDPCAVYLMRNEWADSNYKIGISCRPNVRDLEVRDQYKNVSTIVHATCWFPSSRFARKAETGWHRYFSEYRTDDHGGREWFSLTQFQVSKFLEWSINAKSDHDLKHWLFADGARKSDVRDYQQFLLKSIPHRRRAPSVDVWTSPMYMNYPNPLNEIFENPSHIPT
jgi:hypothetical protein